MVSSRWPSALVLDSSSKDIRVMVVVMFFVQCDFTANFVEVEGFILYAGWLTISILERAF